MTIGADLRRAREERNVSLRELADRTKIRVPVLRAIENDDFKNVPGGVILRGFLKLYAREVGLDPDEIARRCVALQAHDITPTAADAGPGEGGDIERATLPAAESRLPMVLGIAGVLAIVVLAAAYLAWRPGPRAPEVAGAPAGDVRASAPAPDRATPVPATAAAAEAPAAPAAAPRPLAAGDALRVEVTATDACWLAATADGTQVAYRVLNPGDRVSLSARDEAVLRIGMPGHVTITINDAPVQPFVRPASPTTIRITPANYRELLAP
jgi:cytoskeleton protein RodZ